jgi:riboflavin synthase
MFTGIIEEQGTIRKMNGTREGARLEVAAEVVLRDARIGDSVAVNGVCLTAVEFTTGSFSADVSSETLRRTSLGEAHPGTRVNLERPLTPSARLGGHIVQGHVDGTGQFLEARPAGDGWVVRIGFPDALARYIVEKGSIAVDGISLTVAALNRNWFEIAVIPHTWKMTNLSSLSRGAAVNLEVDIIAKYVERMMQAYSYSPKEPMTLDKLSELGY